MSSRDTSYFLKLFDRGRYVTTRSIARNEASSEDQQHKHKQRERFAVTAIAFCYEHDPRFREFFLSVVAGLKPSDIGAINVEPEQWADLVLEGKRDVVVLEFKLQAALGGHQDPNAKGRLFARLGYGSDIIDEYSETGKRLRYVIIGKDGSAGRINGLEYHVIPWIKFLRKGGRETALERDLFDCLGTLGAPIFLTRHMKKKAPTKEATGALEVYQLLTMAAGGIPTDVNSGLEHIGLDLRASGATPGSPHKVLRDVVNPVGRSIGWIGYERRDEFGGQLCLSVWFYSSRKGKNLLRKQLRKLETENKGKILEEKNSVGLLQPAVNQRDHGKWIDDVLKAVTDSKNWRHRRLAQPIARS